MKKRILVLFIALIGGVAVSYAQEYRSKQTSATGIAFTDIITKDGYIPALNVLVKDAESSTAFDVEIYHLRKMIPDKKYPLHKCTLLTRITYYVQPNKYNYPLSKNRSHQLEPGGVVVVFVFPSVPFKPYEVDGVEYCGPTLESSLPTKGRYVAYYRDGSISFSSKKQQSLPAIVLE